MPFEKSFTRYCCETCGSDYGKPAEAKKCEQKKTEIIHAWIQAGKEIITDFFCGRCRVGFTIGKIKKIVGPTLPDYDFEVRCICRQERRTMHVYYVYVVGRCGCCKGKVRLIKAPFQIQENKRF